MTVVYLDSVFLLNGVMDYLLLTATAHLAGIRLRRGRYLLGALAGGLYAAAVFLPGMAFLADTPVKLAAGVLLALVAFGGEARLLRLTLLLFGVSCALAGCVLGLGLLAGGGVPMVNGIFYTDVSIRVLLISAAAAYGVLTVVFRASARNGMEGYLLPVRVCLGGRTAELTALWDTGNGLRDPLSGQGALVAAGGALDGLFSPQVRRLLPREGVPFPADRLEELHRAAPELRLRLVPYRSVGTAGGLLLAVASDWTEIEGRRYPGLLVALAPGALGTGYAALWGGERGKGGRYEKVAGKAVPGAGAPGTAAGAGGPLHRGQRCSAAAADPGAGGGAAGAVGPGAGPAGAHRT